MDLDGATAARIADDVDREVERLNDLLAAMSDVYGSSSAPTHLSPPQTSPMRTWG